MGKLANIWAFIGRHKYWVTIGAFLLIIGVLDENSLIRRIAHKREIHQLNTEIERYRKQYEEDRKLSAGPSVMMTSMKSKPSFSTPSSCCLKTWHCLSQSVEEGL